ncbi:hypothetical protein POZ21_21350 [Bacteroides uniformis]|uniref:Uncharacterized protein n=1 Tax=Bacteroides uniformis TaxID=820 RepID=A0AAW6H682_BACUN|nr:hypothetical protein [Bacteroides uniformis]MDC1890802.1 hypothetical protein [Bacteroides uniformis]MDC1895145.1 hypothetical protein [Bacteroides uniformis]MDC1901727.1 hypothetical protein [Bacteroides uniformis]MDC1911482.1 hypothetical protein [Bacteroides uniformis]
MEAPKVAWYARRIFNPNASISCRPVESDLYIQQNIYLGNHSPEPSPSGTTRQSS